VERELPGEHLIAHDAEAVEVAPAVDLAFARRLLRAHERRRPDRHPRAGERRPRAARQRLGDAEVGDHHPPPAPLQQDVVRLDVAVDHADGVGGAQRVGGLRHDPADLVGGEAAAALEPARHRFPVHVPHDEVHQAGAFADGVDGNDVRVGEASRRLGFAGEPLADVALEGELGREDLDCDPALEPLVTRPVDHAHSAPPDLPLQRVVAP
jgi:hypothetical protein